MKLEDFKKAQGLVDKISAIEELIKNHKLGRVSEATSFTENNDDFYNANFINVFESKEYHSTGGGSCDLCRIKVSKFKDGSGDTYTLSKQETIKLQEFLKAMLDERLSSMKIALNNI